MIYTRWAAIVARLSNSAAACLFLSPDNAVLLVLRGRRRGSDERARIVAIKAKRNEKSGPPYGRRSTFLRLAFYEAI